MDTIRTVFFFYISRIYVLLLYLKKKKSNEDVCLSFFPPIIHLVLYEFDGACISLVLK